MDFQIEKTNAEDNTSGKGCSEPAKAVTGRHGHISIPNKSHGHTHKHNCTHIHNSSPSPARKATASTDPNCSSHERGQYILRLEEIKNMPIFWSGSEPVSKLEWVLTPNDHKLLQRPISISEVLEKFVAQEYLRHCTVSIATNSNESTGCHSDQSVRMSDSFSTLFSMSNKGNIVKLVLDATEKRDVSRELCSKYLLVISEMNKSRVIWDGVARRPVSNMIARVNESQMLTTLGTILRKHLPADYLKSSRTKFQLVVNKRQKGAIRDVHLDDLLGSLFQGPSSSLRIWHMASNIPIHCGPETSHEEEQEQLEEFEKQSLESFWLHGNWNEIREKVQYLLEDLERVRTEREISVDFDNKLTTLKHNLETSMRRRSRTIEEVWRRYEELKTRVALVPEKFGYKSEFEHKVILKPPTSTNRSAEATRITSRGVGGRQNEAPPPSESWDNFNLPRMDISQRTTSCLDVFAHTLRGMGMEIYDEEERVSPIAGVAFTVAVVVVICVISQCVT